ncbi:hypothetical protein EDC94DRAFT_583927 [Helicostylum pulchrum]|nr:hypothetical protein EDC94DRAFT_583927 [Helicostylum pulchrum]
MNSSKISECIICCENSFARDIYRSLETPTTCNHAICDNCLLKYLNEDPDGDYSQDRITIQCPGFQCYIYKYIHIENNSRLHNEAISWWKRLFQKKACISYKVYCPMEGCDQILESNKQLEENCTFVVCRGCNRAFCSACKKKWHTDVVKRVDNEELRRLSLKTAKDKNWCIFPKCSRIIDKIDGCANIKCICGSKICYRCGRLLYVCKHLCDAYDSDRLKKLRDTMFE